VREKGRGSDLCLVGRIDKENEPPRLILRVQAQLRYVHEEDGIERLGDLEVVGRAERLAAQLDELELGDGRCRERNVDLAAPDGERAMLDDFLRAGERVEQLGDLAASVVVDGVKVDLAEGTRTLAVV